ncbi:response regulator transcription factor [Qingshengfaniella alkalisoli]|uniref:Response regulator transcription factor n=1 Tax=Qingshengfaniella alkalisoli TaxID=2599296 RepID=A0A5B8IYA3_9RHOB|nr:response regulator transcription factor [Qingshengfaniella alkalisoli]QDY70573.1 response regulator transcription factor [Qingshengfaniella alkalisoli]
MNKQETQIYRVLIADDHAMILEMFEHYLGNIQDVSIDTAPDLDAAISKIDAEEGFDLVLVDLNMPGMNGLSGLGKAIEHNNGKPVGILTSNPAPHIVTEILALGGAGVVLKTAALKNLANEIRFMASGGRYIPVELIERQQKMRERTDTPLSEREMTVLALLAEGKSNREIGASLSLAEPTVKMHVKSICTKLEANNRTQAVVVARNQNII